MRELSPRNVAAKLECTTVINNMMLMSFYIMLVHKLSWLVSWLAAPAIPVVYEYVLVVCSRLVR